MNTLIEKLDRAAQRWVNMIDNDLQQVTVQAVTGKVFTHDLSAQECSLEDETLQQNAPVTPVRQESEPRKADRGVYPPVLRKASASNK